MPPNILVILVDDHAQWAARPYGNSSVHSPSLDYLARHGVCATNAFTVTPVCSPARASFFTGRLPCQHGIHDYLLESQSREINWLRNEVTLAQLLHDAGYTTALTGKWHCGQSHLPAQGFDYWLSYQYNQRPHRGQISFSDNGHNVTINGFQTPFITQKAISFLQQRDHQRPFFLVIGYVDTHAPFRDHPSRLVDRYLSEDLRPLPAESFDSSHGWARFRAPDSPEQRRLDLAQYYAAVTYIDEQVGRLLDELEAQSILESTFVLYVSDHGHMNGQHGLYTKGNATVPQNFYEESIRIPLLMSWPESLPQGMHLDNMVDHLDLFLTLLEAAGIEVPPRIRQERRYPGTSMLALLRGEPVEWRRYQYGEYGNARMLRTERYKLIRRYTPHADRYPDELYDLISDPHETHNRIDDPSLNGIKLVLDALIEAYFARYEDPSHSAKRILEQPIANPNEPWRLEEPPTATSH